MHRLILLATVIVSLAVVASCQLSCDSQLRLLRPSLFTHCTSTCTLSDWTAWEMVGRPSNVPTSQCKSGKAFREVRRRTATGDCSGNVTEEYRTVCEPELVDQLIIGLGLGSGRQDIDSTDRFFSYRPNPTNLSTTTTTLNARQRRSNCNARQICHHVTTPRGKRSLPEEKDTRSRAYNKPEPKPLSETPIPFNIAEHGARYRRQQYCQPDGIQHVLFVLDSSGSVGRRNFDRVTAVLSELVLLFCRPIRVAVMTFDHEYFVEFCFNCYDNTCGGRLSASNAMAAIDYSLHRTGTRYTHTAGAAKCVCDVMLHLTCGLPTTANCIDVVFITDGRSNDPNRDVCQDIRCLHRRFGVTTYAIGIGNVNHTELQCISNADPREYRLFDFDNFDDFVQTFNNILYALASGGTNSNGDPYVCVGTQGPGTVPCRH